MPHTAIFSAAYYATLDVTVMGRRAPSIIIAVVIYAAIYCHDMPIYFSLDNAPNKRFHYGRHGQFTMPYLLPRRQPPFITTRKHHTLSKFPLLIQY